MRILSPSRGSCPQRRARGKGRSRRALVTGASSGIGEAIVDHLAEDGTDVILVGRDAGRLEAAAARARHHGVHAETLVADLAGEAGVTWVMAAIRDSEPMIDLLVNNAGIGQCGPFLDLPIDGAIAVMRVNNEALVRLTNAALSRMIEAGHGSIIQISSTASVAPGPGQAIYAATKAFVSSFGQALTQELAGTGVTCTTVLPGYTATRFFERVGLSVDIPEKRWMTAAEVASIALEGARNGRSLVIPGAVNRRSVSMATLFPSLAKGIAVRRLRQARDVLRTLSHRLTRRVPPRMLLRHVQ